MGILMLLGLPELESLPPKARQAPRPHPAAGNGAAKPGREPTLLAAIGDHVAFARRHPSDACHTRVRRARLQRITAVALAGLTSHAHKSQEQDRAESSSGRAWHATKIRPIGRHARPPE